MSEPLLSASAASRVEDGAGGPFGKLRAGFFHAAPAGVEAAGDSFSAGGMAMSGEAVPRLRQRLPGAQPVTPEQARVDWASVSARDVRGLAVERLYFPLNAGSRARLRGFEIVARLQTKPDARRCAKVARETQGSIGGDGALAAHDLADPHRRYADARRHAVLAEAERLHEIFQQDFAGVNGGQLIHRNICEPPVHG